MRFSLLTLLALTLTAAALLLLNARGQPVPVHVFANDEDAIQIVGYTRQPGWPWPQPALHLGRIYTLDELPAFPTASADSNPREQTPALRRAQNSNLAAGITILLLVTLITEVLVRRFTQHSGLDSHRRTD